MKRLVKITTNQQLMLDEYKGMYAESDNVIKMMSWLMPATCPKRKACAEGGLISPYGEPTGYDIRNRYMLLRIISPKTPSSTPR